MNAKRMDELTAHCDRYFEQENDIVFQPNSPKGRCHIDILVYEPTEARPYWKLVTMGASDYKMPPCKPTVARRNEYIMLIDKDVDMTARKESAWYCEKLLAIADYAHECKTHVTCGHSVEWKNDDIEWIHGDKDDEMVGAFFEAPLMFGNGMLFHKAGPFRKVACLLVILLNRSEVDRLLEIGPDQFSDQLSLGDENAPTHFLSERHRSEKF